MKGKNTSESPKFRRNLENLILNGIHVLLVITALIAHPVVEVNPDRALPQAV